MKYNPKLNEEIAALPGFRDAHPLARADKMQGSLAVIDTLSAYLAGITGMDAVSLQPCAGAHGEFTAMLMVRAYHRSRGDEGRTKVLIPDSAHGTQSRIRRDGRGSRWSRSRPRPDGSIDLADLRLKVGEDTAALMLTNPQHPRQVREARARGGGYSARSGAV